MSLWYPQSEFVGRLKSMERGRLGSTRLVRSSKKKHGESHLRQRFDSECSSFVRTILTLSSTPEFTYLQSQVFLNLPFLHHPYSLGAVGSLMRYSININFRKLVKFKMHRIISVPTCLIDTLGIILIKDHHSELKRFFKLLHPCFVIRSE